MRAAFAILLAWLCLAAPALAEKRLALVIGNNDYQHIAKLKKAVADATAYENVLREKGFLVQVGYDLSMEDMKLAVADFVEKIQPGDTVVFIYSGHGWSDGAHNYLVGVDAPGRVNQERLTALSLPLRNGIDGVLDGFQRKSAGLVAAIIDACRDDPFQPPPGEKGYALTRGLKPQSVEGSFVIYSASEGQAAMDGLTEANPDPNSVFTRTFLPELRADRPLQDAIKTSQKKTHDLAASANHDQTPAYYDNVLGEACLSAACKTSGAASTETGTGTKVALVIGNSKYASVGELPNPANDADSIADALTRIGFKVTVKKDVARQEFGTALKEFSHELSKADTALFYFSGHGVQVNGKNYLMPIDSKDIEYDSMPIDLVVGATNKAHKTKILVLDASCDDGASDKYATASETPSRSLTDPTWTGFAPFELIINADGLIIFYSAQPGKEAVNDAGSKNSPFAELLAKRLVEPNAKMADTFKLVVSDVLASTGNLQKPVYSNAPPDIVLYPAETAAEAWRSIKNSKDPEKFKDFQKRYPNSEWFDSAQDKLDKIDAERRLQEFEKAAKESEEKAKAAERDSEEANKRADEIRAAEAARIAKEQADKEKAAKEADESKKKLDEDRLAEEQKAADEKRKAEAAAADRARISAAEQARIAKEKADKDAETKRLADQAAAIKKKQAEEADEQQRQELARQAAENDRRAKEAADAAQRLEEAEKQRAKEEEARKKQEAEAEAKRVADACAHDEAELAQLAEAGKRDAILALAARSLCPALPAAGYQAFQDIALREAKVCAADQAAFARIDQKDEIQLKAALETFKCESVRTSASAQIAKLADERAHQVQVCAAEHVAFAAIDLFAPPALDQLEALGAKVECTALRTEISKTKDDLVTRLNDAQLELQRLGCYSPAKPSGRFDDATTTALNKYLAARKASADAPKITEALIDELQDQIVKFCPTEPASPPPVAAKPPVTAKPPVVAKPPMAAKPPVIASRPPTSVAHPQWESAPPPSVARPQRELAPPPSWERPRLELAPPPSRREPASIRRKPREYDDPPAREAFRPRPEVQPQAPAQRPSYSAPSQGGSTPMGTFY